MGQRRVERWFQKLLDRKMTAQNKELGELLKRAREEARLSQAQAAYRMGHDQSFISRIEAGIQQPTFAEVEQLASYYGKKPLTDFATIAKVEEDDPTLDINVLIRSNPEKFEPKRRKRKTNAPANETGRRQNARTQQKRSRTERGQRKRGKKH